MPRQVFRNPQGRREDIRPTRATALFIRPFIKLTRATRHIKLLSAGRSALLISMSVHQAAPNPRPAHVATSPVTPTNAFLYAKAAALLRFMRQISGCDARGPTNQPVDAHGGSLARSKRCSRQQNGNLLESLLPELRLELLLHMPDLRTLQSLVHASPFFHAQYRESDHKILCTCLKRELDGFCGDAYTTMITRQSRLKKTVGRRSRREDIQNILKKYQGWLLEPPTTPDLWSADPSSVKWLAAYHQDVVQPMVDAYSQWAMYNLNSQLSCCRSSVPWPQRSRSEEIRIYRAVYRYAIFHHLVRFCRGKWPVDAYGYKLNGAFFGLFEPWEVEAIGCIELFFKAKYRLLCKEVAWDLNQRNPKFLQQDGHLRDFDPLSLVGCQPLDDDISRSCMYEDLIATD
ncbi:hypothetical protein E4U43_001984 [Claviceps pusilla]|uniref:Uncharacterized protein n=1 Tax=Claviceps pusilla TaxID=123648 RepID=A0A9P7N9D9_9HYPO|nr:hypothetical protein E4U43_001984 [Claviceps pusilla]